MISHDFEENVLKCEFRCLNLSNLSAPGMSSVWMTCPGRGWAFLASMAAAGCSMTPPSTSISTLTPTCRQFRLLHRLKLFLVPHDGFGHSSLSMRTLPSLPVSLKSTSAPKVWIWRKGSFHPRPRLLLVVARVPLWRPPQLAKLGLRRAATKERNVLNISSTHICTQDRLFCSNFCFASPNFSYPPTPALPTFRRSWSSILFILIRWKTQRHRKRLLEKIFSPSWFNRT